jgi:hypothetical protein
MQTKLRARPANACIAAGFGRRLGVTAVDGSW